MKLHVRFALVIGLIGSAAISLSVPAQTIVTLGSGFNLPTGVAVDGTGDVFVADYANSAVKEILAVGDYTTVNTLGSGFLNPFGVAIDGNGNVFVADLGNNAVKEILAASGYATVNTLGSGFLYPSGVAVAGSGNVFVADSFNNKVKVIQAPDYTTVDTFGSVFSEPYGVAVDGSGNIFVADFNNSAVKEILASSFYTTTITLGSGFNKPRGLAVDGSGNVFVADTGNNAVKKILAAGGYTTVTPLGSGFSQPCGVAVDGSGNVFVADYGNSAVKVILAHGLISQSITNFVASPAKPIYADGSFTVSATGGASGNPVIFSIDSASAGVCAAGGTNGASISILANGTCTVLANQLGGATYSAAPELSLPVEIGSVGELVQDGGFEAGLVPTYWAQTSTAYGTPICAIGFCSSVVGPRTGDYWVWFGGTPTADASSVQQTGVIAAGPKTLNFYVWWSSSIVSPPDPGAFFLVKIDGNTIFGLTPATAAAYHAGYTLVSVAISGYADGNPHTLRFETNNAAASGDTDIQLDDISVVDDRLFANGFE